MSEQNNLFAFFGENRHGVLTELRRWKTGFLKKEGDLNLAVFDGKADAKEVMAAAEAAPFLGSIRLVIVRDFEPKAATDTFLAFLEDVPETTRLAFFFSGKPDARTRFFKTIKKLATVKEFANPKPAEFRRLVTEQVATAGLALEPRALELLATFTAGDLAQLENEIQKLQLFSDGQKITAETVERLVHRDLHTSVFQLTDAIGGRQIQQAVVLLSDFATRGENLFQLLFMIVRQFRILLQTRALVDSGADNRQIAQAVKLPPFLVGSTIAQARNFTPDELRKAHGQLLAIDTGIKTGKIQTSSADQTQLQLTFERFVVSFAK